MGLFSRKRDQEPQQKMARELTIQNRLGLHARPSAMFVKTCSRFRCDVWVEKDGERVNGKSIMGLMMLAAGHGSKLHVVCEGPDSDRALQEIEALVASKFNEE
jgi:phosphocarrier protein HPr